MSDQLSRLFRDFDRGLISRRTLLQTLGVAAAVRPALAFAQGSCGGARASLPECDHTPAKLPFQPTGWKTVLLDHFSMQVADYQKEAAYFQALMNWKIRSDDGKQAMLDIGDWGGLLIRGGYQPPAPPAARAADPATAAATAANQAAGRPGGAGGGRGGGGGRQNNAIVDGFCWGIEPWDVKKVEAALKERGLNPIADHNPKEKFESFHVLDPGGFDLQISNGNMKNRRQGAAAGKSGAPAPFESTKWKTVWLDHISFQCVDYKASAAFYNALLGWKLGEDEGSQNQVQIGDVGDAIIRGTNMSPAAVEARAKAAADAAAAAAAGTAPTGRGRGGGQARTKNAIDHIAFGITPWDIDAVRAELEKRNLSVSADSGGAKGPNPAEAEKEMEAKLGHPLTNLDRQVADMHGAKYQSYHTNTPNGFNLQISMVTKATRGSN